MTLSHRLCRTALFGLVFGVAGCDVLQFANDPKPRFVETWNLPMPGTRISVAQLLPDSILIYSTPASNPPDSSAFQVSMASVNFSRRVGDDCAACQALNGTTTIKPAFTLSVGNSRALPSDVVSGALVNGSVDYTVTNGLSFDPLRVSTTAGNPQGFMIIVVRSGSLVLARDSVNGATTALAPGTSLIRSAPMSTGNVTGSITVDLTLNSPQGDHNEPINANGTLGTTAGISNLRLGSVQINVPSIAITPSAPTDVPNDIDPSISSHVTKGELEMSIANPFAITGNVNVNFVYGPQPSEVLVKAVTLPASTTTPAVRSVSLDSTEMNRILCGAPSASDDCPQTTTTTLTVSGALTSTGPVLITPKQEVSITNRLKLTVRVGGGS